jgi:hypothetical protein
VFEREGELRGVTSEGPRPDLLMNCPQDSVVGVRFAPTHATGDNHEIFASKLFASGGRCTTKAEQTEASLSLLCALPTVHDNGQRGARHTRRSGPSRQALRLFRLTPPSCHYPPSLFSSRGRSEMSLLLP